MPINMQDDLEGEQLTEGFENCELTAYWDPNGKVWTIGWGHTGPEVVAGLTWTQEQCDAALLADRAKAVACINAHVNIPLTRPEFRALVDFVFNAGCGAFENSTLLKKLNMGDYAGAAAEFVRWDHSGGKVLAGLLRRREAETAIFKSGEVAPGGPA